MPVSNRLTPLRPACLALGQPSAEDGPRNGRDGGKGTRHLNLRSQYWPCPGTCARKVEHAAAQGGFSRRRKRNAKSPARAFAPLAVIARLRMDNDFPAQASRSLRATSRSTPVGRRHAAPASPKANSTKRSRGGSRSPFRGKRGGRAERPATERGSALRSHRVGTSAL